MSSIIASESSQLEGLIRVPGDKSISHRAVMLGAISLGESHIQNLLEIGSQSHENTKYDVVSTHLLGDIARPAPPPPPPPPPDPVCFQDDDDEPDERVDFDKQENCCADAINKPRNDK